MANVSIDGLTALGAAPATGDELVLVDISDTAQSPQGSTKKFTVGNLFSSPSIAAPTLVGPVTVTGTLFTDSTIRAGAAFILGWVGRSSITSPSDGTVRFRNNSDAADATIIAGGLTLTGFGGGTGVASVGAVDSGGSGFRVLRVPN